MITKVKLLGTAIACTSAVVAPTTYGITKSVITVKEFQGWKITYSVDGTNFTYTEELRKETTNHIPKVNDKIISQEPHTKGSNAHITSIVEIYK